MYPKVHSIKVPKQEITISMNNLLEIFPAAVFCGAELEAPDSVHVGQVSDPLAKHVL